MPVDDAGLENDREAVTDAVNEKVWVCLKEMVRVREVVTERERENVLECVRELRVVEKDGNADGEEALELCDDE